MTDFVGTFIENWSYLGLFLVLLACGFGLPLPEDIPLLLSGYLVHRGLADLTLMCVVGMVGVLCGDSIMFFLGRRYGEHIVEHPLLMKLITRPRLAWAEQQFLNRGAPVVFVGRFMAGARSVVFLTAGIFKMPYWKFVLMDGSAALISVPLWVILAAKFGDKAEAAVEQVKSAGGWAIAGLAVVLIAYVLWRRNRRLQRRAEEEAALRQMSGLIGQSGLIGDAGKSATMRDRSNADAPTGANEPPRPGSIGATRTAEGDRATTDDTGAEAPAAPPEYRGGAKALKPPQPAVARGG